MATTLAPGGRLRLFAPRRDRFSVSRKGSSGALTEGGVDSPASRVLPRVAGRQQTYMQFDLFFLLCRPVEGNPLGLLAHPPPSGVSSRLLRTWRAESASFQHTFVHNCCARMGWVLASYIVFFHVFRSFAICLVHSLMIWRFLGICSTDCLAGLIASIFLYWSAPGVHLRRLSLHCIVCCDCTRWLLCYWPSRAAKNGRKMQTDFQTFCISRRDLLRQQVERQTPVCRTC